MKKISINWLKDGINLCNWKFCVDQILLLYSFIICLKVLTMLYDENISTSNKHWLYFVTDSNGCPPFTVCVVPEALYEFLTVCSYKYFQGDWDFGSRIGFRAGWLSQLWLYRGADCCLSVSASSIHRSVFTAQLGLKVRLKTPRTGNAFLKDYCPIRKSVSQFHEGSPPTNVCIQGNAYALVIASQNQKELIKSPRHSLLLLLLSFFYTISLTNNL